MLIYARQNYDNVAYSFFLLLFSVICYRICNCNISKWYNVNILFFLFMFWNDIMLLGACGILYSSFDWFFIVCVCLCVSSSVACIYEHYGYVENKEIELPRITFLEL